MSTVRYAIKGTNDSAAIDQAKQGLLGLGDGVNKLNGLFKAFVGLKVIQGLGKAAGDTMAAFSVQQNAVAQLTNAIKNNANLSADSLKRLTSYASGLQKKGIYGDEELLKQASYLASLGLTEDKIKGVMEASANLAAAGVMPLDAAVKNMAKQFGGMAGELGEKIPALRTLTAEQLKAGEGIALVQKQYAGALETAASTLTGATAQATNVIGDIKGKIGAIFAVGKMGLLQAIQPGLEAIDAWFEKNLPRILNFFINFPEIAAKAFEAIEEMMAAVFTIQFWVNYFQAVGGFTVSVFKSMLTIIWELVKTIAATLWNPLQWAFESLVFIIQSLFIDAINGILKSVGWLIDKINMIPGINIDTKFLNSGMAKPTAPVGRDDKIIDAWKSLGSTFTTEVKSIGSTFAKTLGEVGTPFAPIFDKFKDDLSTILNQELPENIKNILSPTTTLSTTPEAIISPVSSQVLNTFDEFRQGLGEQATLLADAGSGAYEYGNQLETVADSMQEQASIFKFSWEEALTSISSKFQEWGDFAEGLVGTIANSVTGSLENIGAALYEGSAGWDDFGAAGLKALAEVLRGLGAQLAAMSVLLFIQARWAGAALALAGSIAAYLAAGYVSAAADDITSSSSTPGYTPLPTSDTSPGSSGGSSASYSGSRDVTVNIYYSNSYVNGDAREIALNIRNEIKSAEALGLRG